MEHSGLRGRGAKVKWDVANFRITRLCIFSKGTRDSKVNMLEEISRDINISLPPRIRKREGSQFTCTPNTRMFPNGKGYAVECLKGDV